MSFFSRIIRRQKRRGIILSEVLVSLLILTMGFSASSAVMNFSIKSNKINSNKIIATNLAREGIEAIRILRDNNWMRYGDNMRVCWNFWENTNEDTAIDSNDTVCTAVGFNQSQHPMGLANDGSKIKSFLVVLNPQNMQWVLTENFYTFESTTETFTKETYKDTTLVENGDDGKWINRKNHNLTSQLYRDSATGLYSHYNTAESTPTDFYREIRISYPLGVGEFFPINQSANDNQMQIMSIVWYPSFDGQKTVVLETELTDYLYRTNWSD